MNSFHDAFISYGRADSKAFATKLHTHLLEAGLKIWFDQNDIPLGVDFQNQIDDGIEKAHNFLFIIAPHSVNSPYCLKEIELAIKLKKRIIPLLHVEQISQETWQQRFPKGTEEEWETYQAQGKHTVFQNMHPTIGKINWVYFREGIDDFEKSFAGLVELFKRHGDYVEKHTQFLAKALEWERQKKQTSYLLTGDEKQQAQTWLKRRFQNEQPPCLPTDLHCEYITESIKNGNNLMTQVFLSYTNEERATMEKIRNSLRRESITVWTNTTDIQTGEDFEKAIKRGIEQADNLVYLLSPDSVNSPYCQQELEYARSLHKRIIPLLVGEVSAEQVPSALRELHYIDLTDNEKEEDYLLDESELLKILHQDEAYYNEHKVLLTKALKWEQQHDNPSILLRGYNLRSAEAWLKVAKTRTQHPPTQLQEEFIAESLRQPPLESLDVFISYSRADSDFARKLNDSLQMQGKTTWFDQESIASGSDFAQEINRGIKASDNFLFILSPRSVNSPYCNDEVEYAASLNKRFVTVLHREVNTADLHPELAKVQWIDFNQNQKNFNANFNQLVRTLDTDREHVHTHSKWSQRALEWQEKDQSADLLLRGSEFAVAERWLLKAEQDKKKPVPTSLQQEYIRQSREAIEAGTRREKRRVVILRSLLGLMSVAFVVTLGVGVLALMEKKNAEKNLAGQVNALSRYSETLSESNQEFGALIEGIRAGKQFLNKNQFDVLEIPSKVLDFLSQKLRPDNQSSDRLDDTSQLEKALREALYNLKEVKRLGVQQGSVVKFSPDNQTIATLDNNGKIILWNFQLRNFPDKKHKILDLGKVKSTDIWFSPGDGKIIATLAKDKTVQLWSKDGNEIASLPKKEDVSEVKLSPDGTLVATFSSQANNRIGKVWKLENQELKPLMTGENFNDVSFSSDGNLIATVDEDTTKIWQLNGDQVNPFKAPISNEKFHYLEFFPEAKRIFTLNFFEQALKFWSLEGEELKFPLLGQEKLFFLEAKVSPDNKMLATFEANKDKKVQLSYIDNQRYRTLSHDAEITGVWFSPNNQIIVTASKDTMVKLWKQNGQEIETLSSHSKQVYDVTFSQDGDTIATASYDKTVKLWDKEGNELQTLYPSNVVNQVRFSSDGKTIATLSKDNIIQFWNFDSSDRQFLDHDGQVNNVRFTTDGKLISTYYKDSQTAQLWNMEGKQPQPLPLNKQFDRVKFSSDGKLMASYSTEGENQTARLWSVEDKQLKPLLPKEQFNRVQFSPNGKQIALFSQNENQTTIKLWRRDKDKNPIRFITLAKEQFNRVQFSPDGKLIAIYSGSWDNQTVKLWSIEGKKPEPLSLNEQLDEVALSPNNKLMAIFSHNEDQTAMELWKREGKPKFFFAPDLVKERFNQVKFSPDGNLIATYDSWSWENRGALWSMENEQLQRLLPKESFNEVKFSPDGKLMATINSKEKTIEFWKRDKDGKPQDSLGVRNAHTVEFSSNGKLIATADDSNTIELWNQKVEELANLTLNDSINNLSFSPDNTRLAIASDDKTAIIWDLNRQSEWERLSDQNLEELVEEGCEKVRNYLDSKPKSDSDRTLCNSIEK